MPVPGEISVHTTGGQVDELVMALIDSAFDKDLRVREAFETSLCELGYHQPALVLSSCYSYLVKHSKLPMGHRVVVLRCMEVIIQKTLDRLDVTLVEQIITQASHEMTSSKEVVPEWQTAASGVLVALGGRFCTEVMSDLQEKYQPGVLPHYFVVQTMANLASANVYGMVPFLKVTMGTMLPMLGIAKHDNMRWVFSTALAKFCEAIMDYVANPEKAPDPSVKKEFFAGEVDAAFDVLFNVWLQSKEPKLRLAIVDALGQMASIMTREKLEEQLPKLLQGILALYKKHPDPYHITQGLCMILTAAVQDNNLSLEPHLEMLLNTLFPQACQTLDYGNPLTIKNHNELLRCFTVLSVPFSDRVVTFLLQKLEGSSEKTKMGALTIFRHLINAGGQPMEDKKQLIISGLRVILADNSNKLKKVFAQLVMAMAHHGYLELEGGQAMVEHIVKQCALMPDPQSKRPADPDYVSSEALRSMCENVLQLLCTTVENMDHVLWPSLLEYFTPEQYTEAFGVLCRSVAQIAERKRKNTEEDYEINYEEEVNVPKPQALIARLLTMCGRPLNGHHRGVHILSAMQSLSPVLEDRIVELWDTVIPKLNQFLEDNTDGEEDWSQKSWEDLLLKFVSKTLDVVDDEEWYIQLAKNLAEQLPLYALYPEEKNFSYKLLGVVLRKSGSKEFVNKHISTMLDTVKHASLLEREGCAMGIGLAAASHVDLVISRLDTALKVDANRKSGSFFGFIKDSMNKSDLDDKTKATLCLCYGYVAMYAPPSLIISRLETSIMKSVAAQFPVVKWKSLVYNKLVVNAYDVQKSDIEFSPQEIVLKQSLIKTVELIGQAMNPEHLQQQHVFVWRGDLLTHMQNYLKAEATAPLTTDIRALALKAISTLVKLEPVLTELETFETLRVALECYIPLAEPGISTSKKQKEDTYEDLLEYEVLLKSTEESLQEFLHTLLLRNRTPDGLENIFKMLYHWTVSNHDYERQRSTKLLLSVLMLYVANVSISIGDKTILWNLGRMLASLVPRCTDPDLTVRLQAMDCIQTVLRINLRYQGHPADYKDSMIEALSTLKDRLKKMDPSVLFTAINDLSKVISKAMPNDQLEGFVDRLHDGLSDPHESSASGACVVLNSILKTRGSELHPQAERLIQGLHAKIGEISYGQTRTGTLRCVRTLAGHHLLVVIKALLDFPLPYDQTVVECWGVLAGDAVLLTSVLDHLLDLLDRSLPYEEVQDTSSRTPKTMRIATILPLAATCALTEIFKKEESLEIVLEKYHRLLAAIMLRLASTAGIKPPRKKEEMKNKDGRTDKNQRKSVITATKAKEVDLKPSSMSVECLRHFLMCTKSEELLLSLDADDIWQQFQVETLYPQAFTTLARLIVELEPQYVMKLITTLNPVLSGVYQPQRIMVAAFLAELINRQCGGDLTLVEMLVNGLLGRLVDNSPIVRMLCIRGLGNIASCGPDQVRQYATTVLSAMMSGMDDKDDLNDDITLEAMSGLSKILVEIDEQNIRAILINICLRIRPCFEKEKAAVRAAAFTLFGNLAIFGDGPSKAPFLEQIHTNLVTMLLHLHDPDLEVRKACKFALRKLGPLMDSEEVNSMFQQHLIEDGALHYGEFMNDLAKTILQAFPEKMNFYVMGNVTFFKSSWPEIRSNAAMFNGFLLGNLDKEQYSSISKEHVCGALILLLKDSSPEVRIKAAEAISHLHHV